MTPLSASWFGTRLCATNDLEKTMQYTKYSLSVMLVCGCVGTGSSHPGEPPVAPVVGPEEEEPTSSRVTSGMQGVTDEKTSDPEPPEDAAGEPDMVEEKTVEEEKTERIDCDRIHQPAYRQSLTRSGIDPDTIDCFEKESAL